jgi:hypothetical protein
MIRNLVFGFAGIPVFSTATRSPLLVNREPLARRPVSLLKILGASFAKFPNFESRCVSRLDGGMVDTGDLKSPGSNTVRVRVPLRANFASKMARKQSPAGLCVAGVEVKLKAMMINLMIDQAA